MSKEALMVSFNKSIAVEFEKKLSLGQVEPRHLTEQQAAFHEAFLAQETSIIGEAVAGSGKSYSLLRASIALPNVSWTVKTCHGLGYSAWQNKIGKRLNVKTNKMFSLLKDLNVDKEDFGDILKLARTAKTFGIVPTGAPRGKPLTSDDPDTWEELADRFDTEFSDSILFSARKLVAASIIEGQKGVVDFDDMLYMPVCFSGVFTRYPLVLVDEAQDLSAIQHEMLRRVLTRRDGILIGCGDRNQAIYGFRGALAESIPDMIESFDMSLYPLTTSFRCPRAVVEEAQKDVPHIQSFEGAIQGEVIHHREENPLTLETIPSTVLCRNTAPLINLGLHLIGSGRGAKIAGRDIGKNLTRMVKKMCKKPVKLSVFDARLKMHIETEVNRKPRMEAQLRDKEAALRAVSDRASALSGGMATSKTIISILEELYDPANGGGVYLSTIHRAKGLEWKDVLFLDPQLVPSCYAKQPWQLQQEHNLRYVGVTRAQQTLRFTDSKLIGD